MTDENGALECHAYMFDTVKELLNAAKAVKTAGFRGGSAVYTGFGRYFLIIYERRLRRPPGRYMQAAEKTSCDALSGYYISAKEREIPNVASEFGTLLSESSEKYITEHCRCLVECDAVNTLSAIA